MYIDVFNGDADGICALLQLRLADPVEATLITGVKRDIRLLERVAATDNDKVTVLDISLAENRGALDRILKQGARVFYVDHHRAGDILDHPNLTALIDTDAAVCTGLLVDAYLHGRYRAWAVTAAFGDNLTNSAVKAAEALALSAAGLNQLKQLGICINYNAYGDSIDDLHFAPDRLYRELTGFTSPFAFIAEKPAIYQQLLDGYAGDMTKAWAVKPEFNSDATGVFILPDEPWARRVSGVFGNELANRHPLRAHAVLSYNAHGGFRVSVRAPLTNQTGADELCASFPTGGGRKGAAGINHLPVDRLPAFITAFAEQYGNGSPKQ